MKINLILLMLFVFYSVNVLADDTVEELEHPVLKLDNIDLEHTHERLEESLDVKINHYDPKPKFKDEQKLDLTIKNNKKPEYVRGNSIAEKDQSLKSNDFRKVKSPTLGNSGSNIRLGLDIDLPNQ